MRKFNRNYRLVFEIGRRPKEDLTDLIPEQEIEIGYPFTLKFKVSTGINQSDSGTCSLQLFNLSETVQKALFKDNYMNDKYILMQFYAGYEDDMPLIFFGFVTQCQSYRQGGSTEYVTEILADTMSMMALYGFNNVTYAKGSDPIDIVKALVEECPGYKLGYLTPKLKPLTRDRTFIGQTLNLLGGEYGGYDVFITNNEVNILDTNEVIPSDQLMVITSESGLLGSPRKANDYLMISMLFEPRIKIGQAIELQSESIPWFNQIYKVYAFEHSGIISPVQNGDIRTDITLWLGKTLLEEIQKSTEAKYTGPATPGQWLKPVSPTDAKRMSDGYGERIHPISKEKTFHYGIDIAAPVGTPVYATANGTVTVSGWVGNNGQLIRINHGKDANNNILESAYAHLSKRDVKPQELVSAGQKIGEVGSTGYSTGPHLHFGVKVNGKAVNPEKYIGTYG